MSDQASRVRRAFVCEDPKSREVHARTFVAVDAPVPVCQTHGKMRLQPNVKYKGKAT